MIYDEPSVYHTTLKPIDWNLSLQLANQNSALARELLNMLIQDLPKTKQTIQQHLQQSEWSLLVEKVHRLHGSCCYCGVPELKYLAHEIESAFKNNQLNQVNALAHILLQAIERVLVAANTEIDSIS